MSFPKYYLAWSKNPEVRTYSSSGGFTKEIMSWALRSGYVDYLVYPIMDGLKPKIITTQDPSLIFTPYSNSVYQPTSSLKGLREVPDNKTCAITLLPCHAELPRSPKIKLLVELLCNYSPTSTYRDDCIRRAGTEPENVKDIIFRTGVWPGITQITENDGTIRNSQFIWFNDVSECGFAPEACKRCGRVEKTGDFIVGDPWYIEKDFHNKEKPGKTLVQVKNEEYLDLFLGANIDFEEIDVTKWDISLKDHIGFKRARYDHFC